MNPVCHLEGGNKETAAERDMTGPQQTLCPALNLPCVLKLAWFCVCGSFHSEYPSPLLCLSEFLQNSVQHHL